MRLFNLKLPVCPEIPDTPGVSEGSCGRLTRRRWVYSAPMVLNIFQVTSVAEKLPIITHNVHSFVTLDRPLSDVKSRVNGWCA